MDGRHAAERAAHARHCEREREAARGRRARQPVELVLPGWTRRPRVWHGADDERGVAGTVGQRRAVDPPLEVAGGDEQVVQHWQVHGRNDKKVWWRP